MATGGGAQLQFAAVFRSGRWPQRSQLTECKKLANMAAEELGIAAGGQIAAGGGYLGGELVNRQARVSPRIEGSGALDEGGGKVAVGDHGDHVLVCVPFFFNDTATTE